MLKKYMFMHENPLYGKAGKYDVYANILQSEGIRATTERIREKAENHMKNPNLSREEYPRS